ncbi:hypothetical protein EIN_085890 [Entamoeba invadens IP1]|uniref:hypothetical protein n=1 Tax=Entamoeba invadens IP1 TaxID=370355 RepID=UPI0002C3D11D|nr:hypothetical protein EIN_085890 [Entamoeba invadens IP1]ELP85337.1 hypothetical protein EIN_085890 [Entamoeba invadens IP1]|eukprot:XP_004184683.1 hypothetical protein EIN_085890 [Entamoeba invadens IP1]
MTGTKSTSPMKPSLRVKKMAVQKKSKEIEEKKPKKDIDEIFKGIKERKQVKALEKKEAEDKRKLVEAHKEEDKRHKAKYTDDGFRIYSLEELGLDKNKKGGNTPLCPFDCDCCH